MQPAGVPQPHQASPAISEAAVARTASYSPAGSCKSDTLDSNVGSNPSKGSPAVSPAGVRPFADENGGSLRLEQAPEQQSITVAVAHGTALSATMTASPPRDNGTSGSVMSAEVTLAPTTSAATAEALRSSGRGSPRERRPASRLSLPSLGTRARDLPHRGQTYD